MGLGPSPPVGTVFPSTFSHCIPLPVSLRLSWSHQSCLYLPFAYPLVVPRSPNSPFARPGLSV